MRVAIKIHSFAEWGIFFATFKKIALRGLNGNAVTLADCLYDCSRIDALMNVQGDG